MPTYYSVDLRNATMREFAFGTPWQCLPFLFLSKLFRLPMSGPTDDPPVETLAPFEVDKDAIPQGVKRQLESLERELAALGFHSPIYHAIPSGLTHTQRYWATFIHSAGTIW